MVRNLQRHAGRARVSPVRTALISLASSLMSCSTMNVTAPDLQAPTRTADAVSV